MFKFLFSKGKSVDTSSEASAQQGPFKGGFNPQPVAVDLGIPLEAVLPAGADFNQDSFSPEAAMASSELETDYDPTASVTTMTAPGLEPDYLPASDSNFADAFNDLPLATFSQDVPLADFTDAPPFNGVPPALERLDAGAVQPASQQSDFSRAAYDAPAPETFQQTQPPVQQGQRFEESLFPTSASFSPEPASLYPAEAMDHLALQPETLRPASSSPAQSMESVSWEMIDDLKADLAIAPAEDKFSWPTEQEVTFTSSISTPSPKPMSAPPADELAFDPFAFDNSNQVVNPEASAPLDALSMTDMSSAMAFDLPETFPASKDSASSFDDNSLTLNPFDASAPLEASQPAANASVFEEASDNNWVFDENMLFNDDEDKKKIVDEVGAQPLPAFSPFESFNADSQPLPPIELTAGETTVAASLFDSGNPGRAPLNTHTASADPFAAASTGLQAHALPPLADLSHAQSGPMMQGIQESDQASYAVNYPAVMPQPEGMPVSVSNPAQQPDFSVKTIRDTVLLGDHCVYLVQPAPDQFCLASQVPGQPNHWMILKDLSGRGLKPSSSIQVLLEGYAGGKEVYTVTVGTWKAVLNADEGGISVHTELAP